MRTAKEIAESIVAREGGYVNDRDDPGGATKFGVTLHTMRRLGIDLTGDGQVTSVDVAQLSRRQAVDIFLEHYFKRPGIDNLPAQIQASVFDMHVNAGANAVKILQRLLVEMGHSVQVDGIIGSETSRAANAAQQSAQNFLNEAYGIARRNYYYSLADVRPKSRKYARRRDGGKGGWIVRAEEFISAKYHLSAQKHQERTAAWD
ncbi:holin-associated N-acetylmuramidase [Pseudohalocynthiibacter aestuariivivens]|jgi:lysozyme family protein|uniref:Holin-associated N-acetylmuramidase n=1 Tax=Pseudohalocynthiibacter aestuariivivens TaxID=1591409 RepID=A0ABV5JGM9_9RHOB|nr:MULTISPECIES: holin-associated N-acetylmuramidase [Pseudohalocynthiibacter]MBS9716419.1 peptidoglycan-binding protein [Pseudohalocynthiibacter aestuariivivens]MCK0100772.1 holin-associated N-acetylmuramidase [Pseudohalocynthiibacter sp. F2068]